MVKVKVKGSGFGTIKLSGDFIVGVVASSDGEHIEGDVMVTGNASRIALADAMARLITDVAESVSEDEDQFSTFVGMFLGITEGKLIERGHYGYRSSEEGEEEVSGA